MGFKEQVGDASWSKFVSQFPQLLKERLEAHYGIISSAQQQQNILNQQQQIRPPAEGMNQ